MIIFFLKKNISNYKWSTHQLQVLDHFEMFRVNSILLKSNPPPGPFEKGKGGIQWVCVPILKRTFRFDHHWFLVAIHACWLQDVFNGVLDHPFDQSQSHLQTAQKKGSS